jgi:hypothetical protein
MRRDSPGHFDSMPGFYDLSLLGYGLSFTFAHTVGELPEPELVRGPARPDDRALRRPAPLPPTQHRKVLCDVALCTFCA